MGDVISAGDNKKAIKKATKAQQAGIQAGIDEQRRQFDLTRSDYAPYLEAGTTALPKIEDLLGLNGADAAGAAINALKASPVFQSLYNTGLETNLQNASATGGIRGGNEVWSLADFGSDTLSQVIENQLAKLGGLAGLGQGATDSVSAFGANTANQVSSGLTSIGNSQFNAILGKQQVNNNLSNQIASIISSIMGGGMGGGAGSALSFGGG